MLQVKIYLILHFFFFYLLYILHQIDCKWKSSYILNVNCLPPGDMHIVFEGRYNYFIIFNELLTYLIQQQHTIGADVVCETPTF